MKSTKHHFQPISPGSAVSVLLPDGPGTESRANDVFVTDPVTHRAGKDTREPHKTGSHLCGSVPLVAYSGEKWYCPYKPQWAGGQREPMRKRG